MLERACEQAARWRADGAAIRVSVNLSARQLAQPDLVTRVTEVIERTATPAGSLSLEVTETALMDDLDVARDRLRQLESLGARVVIDDFGTGWASLTYLHMFPVHALKVDRLFVAGVHENRSDTAIVRSIVTLADDLMIDTVAEGVETVEQLRSLRTLGCRFGQGFLFGRPAPADELDLRMTAHVGTQLTLV
jgi:EAL domain-containing protein (putative c-di-GMP-specific phosphodiesterase class I)